MTNYRKKLLWLYARKRGSGSGGISVSVSGTTPVTLANAIESAIRHMTQFGKLTQSDTPTTANPVDLVCNNGALKWDSENQRIYADGTPEVITVSATGADPQTAGAENLLAVGPVADEQDIISGKVIRRTEVFKYDGTQTVKPTYMSTTGGKDDGAIIVQPRGAEYAGEVVSFESEEGKAIDSLIVTLTPKQEGTGDPSPDNVRPITGTESAEVVRTGANVWDEAWENGQYLVNTGAKTTAAGVRCKNPIPVQGGASYYICCVPAASSNNLGYLWYDASDAYISGFVGKGVVIAPSNARYMRFFAPASWYGTTYNHDISINYPSTDTAYHAYDPLSTTLEVEWGAVGKNLCPDKAYQNSTTAVYIGQDNGTDFPLSLTGGTAYTLSLTTSKGIAVYLRSENDSGVLIGSTNPLTFTPSATGNYRIALTNTNGISVSDISKVMVEKGSSATTYEPYTRTIYGGHLDAVRGVIELTMKEVDLGSLTWTNGSFAGVTGWYASAPSDIKPATNAVAFNGIASQYEVIRFNAISTKYGTIALRDNGLLYVNHSDSPTGQLVYELSTPIRFPIAPHTLTALRNNTVWSEEGSVDVLLGDELVEMVAKQPLRTAEGDNTVSVVSEVGEVELAVTYKGGNS